MSSWQAVAESEPEFEQRVRAAFDAHRHKTMATLRADGGPRISGTELTIGAGELWFGSMPGSRKGADLRRDPRCALHSASVDPVDGDESGWPGDAKVTGRAVLVTEPAELTTGRAALGMADGQPGDVFRLAVHEVVHTRVGEPADHLVIELWRPGHSLTATRRA